MNEKDIAMAEWLEDQRDDDFVKLREQIIILKEHQSVLETCIRHMGIEIEELKKKVKEL